MRKNYLLLTCGILLTQAGHASHHRTPGSDPMKSAIGTKPALSNQVRYFLKTNKDIP